MEADDTIAPTRRDELIERIAEYVVANGLAGLSLRPLAAALNTSPRMLLYHFGSKERLLDEALAAIEARQREELAAIIAAESGGPALTYYWHWASHPGRRAFLRLRHEVEAMRTAEPRAARNAIPGDGDEWLAFIDDVFRAEGVPEALLRPLSTYVAAFVTGCESMLLATGNQDLVNTAFAMFEQDLGQRINAIRGG